jgi:hypothetical protein
MFDNSKIREVERSLERLHEHNFIEMAATVDASEQQIISWENYGFIKSVDLGTFGVSSYHLTVVCYQLARSIQIEQTSELAELYERAMTISMRYDKFRDRLIEEENSNEG